MNKEHWKIEVIRNCIKTMKEEKSKGKITRGEKRDAERTIRFYKIGEEFMIEQVLEIINEKIKEYKEINERIPDELKVLEENKDNQHMRLIATLTTLKKLKNAISGGEE